MKSWKVFIQKTITWVRLFDESELARDVTGGSCRRMDNIDILILILKYNYKNTSNAPDPSFSWEPLTSIGRVIPHARVTAPKDTIHL